MSRPDAKPVLDCDLSRPIDLGQVLVRGFTVLLREAGGSIDVDIADIDNLCGGVVVLVNPDTGKVTLQYVEGLALEAYNHLPTGSVH